jgi:intracellular septation protein
MQLILEYFPIAIFFAAYFLKGDFLFATAVLMAVMPLFMLAHWRMTRSLNKIYLASTVLVLVFGAATLLFHNADFLKWKPTVLNWAIAAVFLGSHWIGDKPIVQRIMGNVVSLAREQWLRLNLIWVGFFVLVGAINLYVAYGFSEAFWVKFKLFGMLGLTLLFVIVQSVWLTHAMRRHPAPQGEQD